MQLARQSCIAADGKKHDWEMLARKENQRGVAVAAVTAREELILVRQFRIPVKRYIYEFPAGLPKFEGQPEEETAAQELLEETGYEASGYRFLLSGFAAAGLFREEIAIYQAFNAKKVQEPNLEPLEDIEVVTAPISRLSEFMIEHRGEIDFKIACAVPHIFFGGMYYQ